MAKFKSGETNVLVATTVIEVGVDVPEATIMVVEHAERFGLAQLHQLRGRVGRGSAKSSCLLIYQPPLGETAKARLKTLRETDDGFVIAEEDLRLRGPGEVLGARQSGMPEFRLADLATHADLLATARDDAKLDRRHRSGAEIAARRSPARAALSVRTRRSGALAARGLKALQHLQKYRTEQPFHLHSFSRGIHAYRHDRHGLCRPGFRRLPVGIRP